MPKGCASCSTSRCGSSRSSLSKRGWVRTRLSHRGRGDDRRSVGRKRGPFSLRLLGLGGAKTFEFLEFPRDALVDAARLRVAPGAFKGVVDVAGVHARTDQRRRELHWRHHPDHLLMGDSAPCRSERQVRGRSPRWRRNRLRDPGSKTRSSFLVDGERGCIGQPELARDPLRRLGNRALRRCPRCLLREGPRGAQCEGRKKSQSPHEDLDLRPLDSVVAS